MVLAGVHHTAGRFEEADRDAELALPHAEQADDPVPACWSANARGIIALYQNRFAEGEQYLTQAIERFRGIGDEPGEASALCNLSRIHLAMGRTSSAIDLAGQGTRIYDAMGHALRGANGRYALGLALTQDNQLASAAEHLREALAVFADSRQRLWEGMTLFRLSEVDLAARRTPRRRRTPRWP